ncbi:MULTISPECIES: molybdopterin-guanine dinucleotide biosynthesis protein B [Veillonella]|uniref:Molybdopterin-guanine dinucleotide biosynthesis protein B n=1 Tax=Veillonella denticariosi JCM 15641 TaxID=1298594 RepID=A0A2S7Z865_9FIRM|nr:MULTISPECIES: molybdopterin-guanine dinucleotide biosynthesis protein B [Veillonella]ETS93248.1 molybdopterin-guanine dinucleotide biosynthesis protein B [Veillonella sp. AS16]PQL19464.1 molybdopterin-guanine dinucleotide biosynthesis protein B [Veillonella denticariosi JCM 15641]
MSELGLIILAGGLSTRMGRPKALLPWVNGESLISHALRKGLEADVKDIIISVGDDDRLGLAIQTHIIDTLSNNEKERVSIVRDSVKRCGPLGGLYSALSVGASPAYAVMAVDMPFMDVSLYYEWLYKVDEDDWNAIVPIGCSGQREPMAGIYRPSIVPLLQAVIAGDDVSLRHAIDIIGAVELIDAQDQSHALRNVNRFEDYQWARALAENEFRRVPLISVVASKRKTGKTTVVTRLVSELRQIGLSVGVVKSDKHGFQMDHEGTDTDLAYKAGADAVAIAGPTETAIRIRTKEQSNLYEISQFMPVDIVILESRSQGIAPIIEVTQEGHTEAFISDSMDRVATIEIGKLDRDVPELVRHIQEMMRSLDGRRYCRGGSPIMG